jgi:hypothetical protein
MMNSRRRGWMIWLSKQLLPMSHNVGADEEKGYELTTYYAEQNVDFVVDSRLPRALQN